MDEATVEHREAAGKKLSTLGRRFFDLIEYDNEEELLLEIRKHPFGLFLVEFVGFSIAIVLGFVPIFIAFNLNSPNLGGGAAQSASLMPSLLIITGTVLALLAIGATFIAAMIYRNNVIYVTDEKIAQVLYTSLFNRKMSQLSIGDVQDVTVKQIGIFPRIFKYGTLTIETAGEQQNYTFSYVPQPYESARVIVGAHESNLKKYGN